MGGGATCICGLSAVISAHLQYSVSTMLPALVAAAVNLRDLNHAVLVLCVFKVLVLGTTVVQHFSRVSDRAPPLAAFVAPVLTGRASVPRVSRPEKYHVNMVMQLGSSALHKQICPASGGVGVYNVSVGGVPFSISCAFGAVPQPDADQAPPWCRGVPFGLVDVNRDRIVSLGEAEDAMTSALPKHVERAGFAQGCKLVTRPGARGCFAKYSTRTLVASATGWTTRDGFSASWSRARCRQRAWRARAPRAMSCDARLVHALAARSRSRGCRVSRDHHHVRLRSIFALGRVILACTYACVLACTWN